MCTNPGAPCYQGDVAARREFSAGGVVVRRLETRWELAVIRPRGRSVLALPKGHIEAGETAEESAIREVREETGLETRLKAPLGDIRYVYRFRGRTIAKTVSFFLLEWTAGTIDDVSEAMRIEVDCAQWIALEDASRLLTYPGEKTAIRAALNLLGEDRG